MAYETVTLAIEAGVARVRLNRPDRGNAINERLADELVASITEAESDPDCHVILLSGNGRFFCAGGDVLGMAASTDTSGFLHGLARAASDAVLRLARSRLIAISVVHGPVAGAGLGLVLSSDLVLASHEASFLAAYAGVGVTPDCGVSFLLPRAVGPRRATEFCVAQRPLDAQHALDWGLVNELHTPDALEGRAAELAAQLAGSATQVLGPTKTLLSEDYLAGYEAALDREVASIAHLGANADTQQRIAAFVARSSRGRN